MSRPRLLPLLPLSLFFFAATCTAEPAAAAAGWTPLQLALAPPAQLPGEDWDVYGLRLDLIAGRCQELGGLDLGLGGNLASGSVRAVEVAGVWNDVGEDFYGLQFSGIGNRVAGNVWGLQAAGVVNLAGPGDRLNGLQLGAVNLAGDANGLQVGLVNDANDMCGVQIGVYNGCQKLAGLQIGLINWIEDNYPFRFFPLLNIGF
ncbi:MAG: hypothetical protein WC789_05060 [Lentisphaeria bacterium]|jgi:hypothetical protein